MNTKNVKINGESLYSILRQYYAIFTLIHEVKACNGNFTKWDRERCVDNTGKALNAKIEIENLIL